MQQRRSPARCARRRSRRAGRRPPARARTQRPGQKPVLHAGLARRDPQAEAEVHAGLAQARHRQAAAPQAVSQPRNGRRRRERRHAQREGPRRGVGTCVSTGSAVGVSASVAVAPPVARRCRGARARLLPTHARPISIPRGLTRPPRGRVIPGVPVHITQLTPLAFLERSAYGLRRPDGGRRRRRPRDLRRAGRGGHPRGARACGPRASDPGDRVAYLCPNARALLVAHFAVPLAGAVLVAINTRLAPEEVRCDLRALGRAPARRRRRARARRVAPVIDRLEPRRRGRLVRRRPAAGPARHRATPTSWRAAPTIPSPWTVDDEDATISINYTSGTTGSPEGRDVHPPRRRT